MTCMNNPKRLFLDPEVVICPLQTLAASASSGSCLELSRGDEIMPNTQWG